MSDVVAMPVVRWMAYGAKARSTYRSLRRMGCTQEQATMVAWGVAAAEGLGLLVLDDLRWRIDPTTPWSRR